MTTGMTTGWCWLAFVDARPLDAWAAAGLADASGQRAGFLAAWTAGRKPVPDALRCAAAIIDPHGDAAWASVVWLPRERSPLFDDPAVSAAMRDVLAQSLSPVSTLVRDASHFAGSLVVSRDGPRPLADDPFWRIARPRVLRVGPGLLGQPPPPAGPAIQRYAGKPWPAPGF